MNSPVEEIKSKLNIVDLVGAYVRLQKSGTHWKAPCPFHNEKTPSFMVNEERQIWHCFGCNKGGDAFAFLMEMEGVDFKEALRILADRTGVELPKRSGERRENGSKNRSFEILELATKFYEKQLWDGVGKKKSLPYLHDRGLSDESIRNFRLGYAPDGWRNILDFLTGRGYSAEEIEKTGLIIRKDGGGHYDRFRDRIMFPIMDILGRVIGYSARVAPGGDESQAKYINTPETDIYRKSRVLYGIQRAKQAMRQGDFTLLVEGNMDVVAAHQTGIANTVAVSGTALTGEQLDVIKRYTENVRLFFDMDGAGQTAARRSTEIALEKGFNVSIVTILQGKDAADIAKENPDALKDAVTRPVPALQYFLDKLLREHDGRLPEGKRKIAHEYLNLLRFVMHDIDRVFWTRKLAEALDVEEKTLLVVLKKVMAGKDGRGGGAKEDDGAAVRESSAAEPFGKRSELLRRQVCGLMFSDAGVWEHLLASLSGDMQAFFEGDPIFCALEQEGVRVGFSSDALLAALSNSGLQKELTRLYFESGKALEGISFIDDDEKSGYRKRLAEQYLSEIAKELRKEEMVRLERAMKDAQERGDKDRLRSLREEFVRLSSF